jgi:hypothetical protein
LNKKIMLPTLAAFMILVMVATAFPAATAVVRGRQTNVFNLPLTIVTIAEDDETREKGIMILCVIHDVDFSGAAAETEADPRAYDPNTCRDATWLDKWADYKILLLLPNGAKFFWPANEASPEGLTLSCEVIEKDTVEPKLPQATWEVLKKMVVDRSSDFECKFRWKAVGGFFWSVGVMDLYYTGPQRSEDVAPYIVDIQAEYEDPISRVKYYGAEMQDLCILAWPFNDPTEWQKRPFNLQKPERVVLTRVPDALDGFVSCEDAVNLQRTLLGNYIPTAPQN